MLTFIKKINIEIRNLITENVALNKPAWQQHPVLFYDAGLAVNGHKTDLHASQCTLSKYGYFNSRMESRS